MSNLPKFVRPTYREVLSAWKKLLSDRNLPTDLLWVFDENLCFEKRTGGPGSFKLGYQTRFTAPPAEGDHIAYDYFADFEARMVFYRIGSTWGKSVCVMLCDPWFEAKREKDGFVPHDEWLISFYPGAATEIEEVTDEERWKQRIVRDRPLHDLDFCMTLRAVHEILAHGRVLSTYEHYALRLLGAWHRFVRAPR